MIHVNRHEEVNAMRGKIVIMSVALFAFLLASCRRGSEPGENRPGVASRAGSETPSDEVQGTSRAERVSALVNAPLRSIGQSRAGIRAKLGLWQALKVEKVHSRHDADQVDSVYTIAYGGLQLKIYEVGGFQKEMLISVRMEKNYPGVLPELVGMQEKAVELDYGIANKVEDQTLEYVVEDELGANGVSFLLQDGKVAAVEWTYYTE